MFRQIQGTNEDEVVDELADEGEDRKSFPGGEEKEEENSPAIEQKEESEFQPATRYVSCLRIIIKQGISRVLIGQRKSMAKV